MAFFHVDILTPAKTLAKGLGADNIELNTEMGQIGVLAKHMNLLSALAPGVLTLHDGEKKKHFFLTSGVLKVLDDKVTIISAAAEAVEEINVERAKRALEKSKEKLKDPQLAEDQQLKYKRKLDRAEARLKAATLVMH